MEGMNTERMNTETIKREIIKPETVQSEPTDFHACLHVLEEGHRLSPKQWRVLLEGRTEEHQQLLARKASALRDRIYGKRVFIRGLIEFTNYCKNNCYYCGIRRSNPYAERYRLTEEEIYACCRAGFAMGFRTFVLQGGEDPFFTADKLAAIARRIKSEFPQCALTLSVGEMEKDQYRVLKDAGTDRYLLRHETADHEHYGMLHPPEMSLDHRMACLASLKELGFQTGAGFMVGSPGQTVESLIEDMMFLSEFRPEMVGIGPFIPHKDTPFCDQTAGNVDLTLYLISLVRLLLPHALLPATTALGTIAPGGREAGILAGANVVMPNLSPGQVRGKYQLYNHKLCTGKEAAECLDELKESLSAIGYSIAIHRGDYQ